MISAYMRGLFGPCPDTWVNLYGQPACGFHRCQCGKWLGHMWRHHCTTCKRKWW